MASRLEKAVGELLQRYQLSRLVKWQMTLVPSPLVRLLLWSGTCERYFGAEHVWLMARAVMVRFVVRGRLLSMTAVTKGHR